MSDYYYYAGLVANATESYGPSASRGPVGWIL